MRHSLACLLTAATLALGCVFAGSTGAEAQSVMRQCADQWKRAEASGTTAGQTWPQFLAQCRASASAAPSGGSFAPAPAPAPAPAQPSSPFPWWAPAAPAPAPASTGGAYKAGQYTTELAARATCPSDTVVWVNTQTGVYHYSGTHYFGHTKRGAFMCEANARAAGNRAARKELPAKSG